MLRRHIPGRVIVLAGGSADHGETRYTRAAREFGRRVALEGWTLRTGGGSGACVMGAAADGALEAGGRVEGVILRKFWGARHRGLHSLRVRGTFAERKAGLFEGADGALICPGGWGTLDELGDLLALKQTGFVRMPIVILNLAGYYDDLLAWARHAAREGFLYGGRQHRVASTLARAISLLR